ncbi:transcriptional repressor of nrd genes [Acetoanaerobium sticklandii]|uniref:Transcriptional repressor NrdR n=1 Tax=Acetoanaerobium sticklandii (strain ATCC 12662 / DSM 519 / JCM 1433 / CCUG 9281 / NCIMB 10654 / HF) TaxID=499177 RepID=E3PT05_ACESD|nr:transcriptional regulator NrdR [Acetoanaerobium sticklandii]CBH22009.1 transcriptional repressor of nrd genes [Acetoanaerobium sticklandii]
MKCPYCDFDTSKVVDSRPIEEGNSIRRRRECENCKKRFTTYEKIEQVNVMIVKKDGAREFFDREKILKGIIRSCEKRPISIKQMENIVTDIEKEIVNMMQREISSEEIGNLVMDKLKDIDEVSYVRFASVYRQFKDVNSFLDELKNIIEEKSRK